MKPSPLPGRGLCYRWMIMTENEYIQGRVQVLLMKEKIKDLKRQQRDMELRFAIREAKEHQRELERRFNHNHDSKGRFASGSNSGLTSTKKSDKLRDISYISARGPNEFKQGFSRKNLVDHWYGLFDENGNEVIHSHREEYEKRHMTMEQYADRALTLVQSACSKDIDGYKTSEGIVVRYDRKTGDYVKGHPDIGIKTMFVANDDYFERWKRRDIKSEEKSND